MRFLSLFSGLGGLDLGLERAGLRCAGMVERDPWCRSVLALRFPDRPIFDDVTTFCANNHDAQSTLQTLGSLDAIVGGDPCQRNSNAWRHGGGEDSLGGEYVRIAQAIRPRFVLRENPSVVRRDAPWPWWRFRSELEALGYHVLPFRLRACCLGAEHRRERLFMLAALPDSDSAGLEGDERAEVADAIGWRQHADAARPDRRCPPPRVCGGADGISARVERRKDRLHGLGNAVDVGVGQFIGQTLLWAANGGRH